MRFVEEEQTAVQREHEDMQKEDIDEVVIEFDTDHLEYNEMSALSRNMGKMER